MNTSTNTQNLKNEMATVEKLQSLAAAKRWWNSLTPSQKGATLGILCGTAVGGYYFYAAYQTVGIGHAIWGSVVWGAGTSACISGVSALAFTTVEYEQTMKNLGDDL